MSDEHKDRYLDLALDKAIGDKAAPDLSEKILSALESGNGSSPADQDTSSSDTAKSHIHPIKRRIGIAAAAACAALGLGLLTYEYVFVPDSGYEERIGKSLLFSDGAKYEIRDNTIFLSSGWVATSDPTLRVKAGDTDASGIKGAALIVAGEPPNEAELARIHIWLQTQPNGKDINMNFLRNRTKTTLLTGGVILITGSALINGSTTEAQDTSAELPTDIRMPEAAQTAIEQIHKLNRDFDDYLPQEMLAAYAGIAEAHQEFAVNVVKSLLKPNQKFLDAYSQFTDKNDSGVNCILKRQGKYSFDQISNEWKGLRSGGCYFSFTSRTNDYNQGPDLEYFNGGDCLSTGFYGGNTGAFALLDPAVTFEAASVDDVSDLFKNPQLPILFPHGRNPNTEERLQDSTERDKAIKVGDVYAVRAIRYDEADTLAVVKILEKTEWGMTFAWRILMRFEVTADPRTR